ncbi:RND family transporter [Thiospirochaeta perfilievii]|uniref:RND family transporter n=1 Tax=Thiospirochaeta perfilievii TaxID=252967 RepID=A0A5C1QHC0_9SPIO|nr:MMPL family transporter [Thiospirochaeta perfilievii]QEN05966.1 RND family transporter [Thiospirochaeta perfilievii]
MKWILKHSKIVISVILLITAFLGYQIKDLVIDNDVNNFFPKDNPVYVRTKAIDDIYGSQVVMDIAITSKQKTILTKETIEVIKNITRDIENLKYVDDVTSLTNSDFPEGSDLGMTVESLVTDDFTGSTKELLTLKHKLLDWPDMYRRVLYSDDFKSTQIITSIDHKIESDSLGILYNQILDICEKYKDDNLEFAVAGNPVVNEVAKTYMYTDLAILIPFVVLVILFSLFISFKKIEGTILPLITVVISTIWTVGLISMLHYDFTVVTTCLPVLLIAVGSAFGIHIINHYYHELEKKAGTISKEEHFEVIIDGLKTVIKPVILASVTTVLGFLSILSSPVGPLKTFGLFSAIGVTIALGLSLVFIPAMLATKKSPKGLVLVDSDEIETGFLISLYNYFSKKTPRIIFITLILLCVSFYGIKRLNIESSLIKYFPEDSFIRLDNELIADKFAGTNAFAIEIKGSEPGDLTDPIIIKKMDELSEYITNNNPEVGKVLSFSDFIKRINKVMNYPIIDESNITDEYVDDSSTDYTEEDSLGDFFTEDTSTEDDSFSDFFTEETSSEDDSFGDFFAQDEETVDSELTGDSNNYTEQYVKEITYSDFLDLLHDIHQNSSTFNLSGDELIEEINKIYNYNGAAYNEVPTDPKKYGAVDTEELKNLISQYLLLYSGSLDLFADDALAPSAARMVVYIKNNETNTTKKIIKDVENFAAINFPENITVECSGVAALELALTDMITGSQIVSLLIALLLVYIIISLSFKSPIAGLFGIVPLSVAIVINFGIMGIFGINLDMITALVASIAIGVGVDYTIHFLNTYHKQRLLSDDLKVVSKNTIVTSGKAIIINAVSVALGFMVLVFSNFIVLRYIGVLVAIIMITSSLAALTILPILLKIFKPKFILK